MELDREQLKAELEDVQMFDDIAGVLQVLTDHGIMVDVSRLPKPFLWHRNWYQVVMRRKATLSISVYGETVRECIEQGVSEILNADTVQDIVSYMYWNGTGTEGWLG